MGQTTISLSDEVKGLLAAEKPDDVSWSKFLDPRLGDLPPGLAGILLMDDDEVQAAAEEFEATSKRVERVDGGIDYDDLVQANREALRKELPDGVFR